MSEYIAKASIEPRDYRVVFLIQKRILLRGILRLRRVASATQFSSAVVRSSRSVLYCIGTSYTIKGLTVFQ